MNPPEDVDAGVASWDQEYVAEECQDREQVERVIERKKPKLTNTSVVVFSIKVFFSSQAF